MRNMKAALREVLLEKEVKEELTATFSKQVEEITGHLEQRINFIEEENARREEDDTKRDEKLKAVKNGTITKTWVYDSKIFIVKKGDDRPKRVFVSKDMPK